MPQTRTQRQTLNPFLIAVLCIAFLGLGMTRAQAGNLDDVQVLMHKNDLSGALTRLDQHLGENPKDRDGRFLKGILLTEMRRLPEAIEVFTALTRDEPKLPEPYNNLAVIYAAQGQFDRAREALELAIKTHPSYSVAHENLGDLYAKLASMAYDKALELDRANTT
ncbi:MAG: tetratricopeptide repeat protein, partial [Betaproteobacteria bacterium]|nr:tetratricopeptide repeat protein [Betaproteobacteria bacterium]